MGRSQRATYAQLNESSLEECSRWLAEGSSFGIVSTQLQSASPSVEVEAHDKLLHRLSSMLLGYRKLVGHWHQVAADAGHPHGGV
jgi:hypothetical protein